MVGILVTFHSREGSQHALYEHLLTESNQAMREVGTLLFFVARIPNDPQAVSVCEVYVDQEAQRTHESAPQYASARARTGELLAGPPIAVPFVDIAGKLSAT